MILAVALTLALGQADADAGVAVVEPVEPMDAGVVVPAALPFEPPPAVQPAAPKAHWALWAQPLGMAGYGAAGALSLTSSLSAPAMVYVPIGANVVLPGVELVIELTVTGQMFGNFQPPRVGAWLSAGPLWHLGSIPLNGVFVQPKVIGAYMSTLGLNLGCGSFCPGLDNGLIAVGVDVGYQFTFRRLYVAFVLGVGLGAGNYSDFTVVSPFAAQFSGGLAPPAGLGSVILVNLNLVRIGGWN